MTIDVPKKPMGKAEDYPQHRLSSSELRMLALLISEEIGERILSKHLRRKRLVDLKEAAEYLGLSEDAVRDLMAENVLKALRPTRKVQFDIEDLDLVIDSWKRAS